jgi:hypothetical protein
MNYKIQLKIYTSILTVGIMGLLSQGFPNEALATLGIPGSQSTTTTTTTNYTTYTSSEYGITFEYPADWDLTEKTNRFTNEPDVDVGYGFNSFKFIDKEDRLSLSDNSFLDLEFVTTMGQNTFVESENGDRLIESASTDEYRIDDHETGSFLYTSNPASSLGLDSLNSLTSFETANLVLFVNNDGDIYTLKYSDDVDDFDTPEGQEIRNHILNSFRFLDSNTNNVENVENDNEDTDDDENN